MYKKYMKEWVEALRSGEFKQGKKRLYNKAEDSYCCLGVLCYLHKDDLEITEEGKIIMFDGSSAFLPDRLSKKLKIGYNPYVTERDEKQLPLTMLNDNFNYSFEQLADLIEAQYKTL